MDGYIWAIAGIILILVELFTTSFFSVFLGIGALLTALFTYLKITESLWSQIILFSIFSIASLLLFRNIARKLFGMTSKGEYSEYVGDRATVEEKIERGKEGKILYRGTVWIAYSDEDRTFEKGEAVIITEINGIKLRIKSIH